MAAAFEGFDWDVAGDGRLWPYPDALDHHHQTWLRDRETGKFLLDVFREPHDGDLWICRRDPSIRLPFWSVFQRTDAGIPFIIPEVVLLFKARSMRPKDNADFTRVVGSLSEGRHTRLAGWLERVHPQHPWRVRLEA